MSMTELERVARTLDGTLLMDSEIGYRPVAGMSSEIGMGRAKFHRSVVVEGETYVIELTVEIV